MPGRYVQYRTRLVRFIKNKESCQFPDKFRLFGYYNDPENSTASRQAGWTGLFELGCKNRMFAEISFPPLGFVLSLESPTVDERLADITHFSRFRYQDYADIYLRLPALSVCSPYPADFRSLAEIKANFDARLS